MVKEGLWEPVSNNHFKPFIVAEWVAIRRTRRTKRLDPMTRADHLEDLLRDLRRLRGAAEPDEPSGEEVIAPRAGGSGRGPV